MARGNRGLAESFGPGRSRFGRQSAADDRFSTVLMGFAVGALLAGILADTYGITTAIWAIAALTAASGLLAAIRMYETHPRH